VKFSTSRRSFRAVGLLAMAALLLTACSKSQHQLTAGDAIVNGQPDLAIAQDGKLSITLTAAESLVPFGDKTRWAMTYNNKVVGPTLVVHPGDKLTVKLVNHLSQETSLHTHGLHVSPDQDNPFIMVAPGESHTYTYDIPKDQAAGTFWYHPHAHGRAAEQVASGLSGAILVEGPDDETLAKTSTNRVLVINDPTIADSNPWPGSSNNSGMGGMHHNMSGMNQSNVDMMTSMMGRTGQYLLTNGEMGVNLTESQGKLERIHLVNATASSRLQFSYSGAKMFMLASEGGRFAAPVPVTNFVLASGERTELILIPSTNGGTLSAQRLSNEWGGDVISDAEPIATVAADAGTDVTSLPKKFIAANTRNLFASNQVIAKRRVVTLTGHMPPAIDGKLFDPNVINFTAKKGTVEEWVIKNTTPMYHPIHLHTWGFEVKGQPGWHDVITVAPDSQEIIRIALDEFAGTTVLHCHILDHEDTGMMAIIKVT